MSEQELYDSGNFGIMSFQDHNGEQHTLICWDGIPFVASKDSQEETK